VDVLHTACLLWERDRQEDLAALIAARGGELWPVAQAVVELLGRDSAERTALMSLLGTRGDLEMRAQRWVENHPKVEARVEVVQVNYGKKEPTQTMSRKREKRRKVVRRTGNEANRQPAARWLHGLAAIGDERWEEALVTLQQFMEVDAVVENRPIIYTNLSACYVGLERYDEALAMLAEAERTMPDSADILYKRGIIYACAGRAQEAIAAFETFGRHWPREARKLEIRNALKKLRHIAQGQLPPGEYLVDHLEEQLAHDVGIGRLSPGRTQRTAYDRC
jgi:tetratricopeptide (TPR) repeat protein